MSRALDHVSIWIGLLSCTAPVACGRALKAPAEEVELRVVIPADEAVRYRTTTIMEMVPAAPPESASVLEALTGGRELKNRLETECELEYRVVTSHPDGSATIDAAFVNIRGKTRVWTAADQGPQLEPREIEFDSSEPSSSASAPASLIGKSLRASVAPDGTVGDIRGAAELVNASTLGDAGPMVGGMMQEMARNHWTEALFGVFFAPFPGRALGIGDRWTIATDARSLGLTLNRETVYEVTSIDEEGLDVSFAGTVARPASASRPEEPGESPRQDARTVEELAHELELEGTFAGSGRISRRDGLCVRYARTTRVETRMPVPTLGVMKLTLISEVACERLNAGARR